MQGSRPRGISSTRPQFGNWVGSLMGSFVGELEKIHRLIVNDMKMLIFMPLLRGEKHGMLAASLGVWMVGWAGCWLNG